MGSCLSLDQEELKARARSDHLDKKLQTWAKEEENVVKILLLGAAESGKSTLVKQMKIIHNDGFSFEELISFKEVYMRFTDLRKVIFTEAEGRGEYDVSKPAVLDNLVSSMKYVLTGMGLLRINLEKPKNRMNAQVILTCKTSFDYNKNMYVEVSTALKALWHDKGVRTAVSRGYEYELNDSAIYYFENMERICSPKFVPTPRDVLRARVRTTGVIETCFTINGCIFRMFDVGGQRSERRKWIQCFDDVRSVLFVSALSAYDMCLLEDATVNRLSESLKLFRGICNNRFFIKACMILFLNKIDLFQDKIKYSSRHLRYFFPEFHGPDKDVDSAARFIQYLFQQQNLLAAKVVYPHFTTATDTSNIQVVFQVVMDSILRDNLKSTSLL